MERLRETQCAAQSQGALGSHSEREIHRLTGLVDTAKSALLTLETAVGSAEPSQEQTDLRSKHQEEIRVMEE
eukprot:2472800-Rhodomonas_salina.1